jgi:O-antigen/teichoic acid export membrane protein
MGRGELAKAKEIEDGVLGSIVLAFFLVLVIGVTFNFVVDIEAFNSVLPLVRVMFLTTGVSLFSAFLFQRFVAHQEFRIVSIIDALRSVLLFGLLLSFSLLWGISGAVWGFFICEVIVCMISGYLSIRVCGKLGINFNGKLIWKLIKVGFPITIVWWFFMLQASVDRIVSITLLGKTATGLYGLGISIVSTLILIPQVVGQVLYPKINEAVGKGADKTSLSALVVTPVQSISLVLPGLLGILILILPTVYHLAFPKYVPGLLSAQILIMGSFFLCLVRNGVNYLIATDKQNKLLMYVLLSLSVKVASALLFIKLGYNIEGIAISSGISGALLTTLIWISVFKAMGYQKSERWKGLLDLYLPFLLLLGFGAILAGVAPNFMIVSGIPSLGYVILFMTAFSLALYLLPPFRTWTQELYGMAKVNLFGTRSVPSNRLK